MGFFEKLKQGLFKTKDAIVGKIDSLFKKFVKVDEELFEELEELLISADIGVMTTEEILDELRDIVKENRLKDPEDVRKELLAILRRMVGEHEPLKLETKPSVIRNKGVSVDLCLGWGVVKGAVARTEDGDFIAPSSMKPHSLAHQETKAWHQLALPIPAQVPYLVDPSAPSS